MARDAGHNDGGHERDTEFFVRVFRERARQEEPYFEETGPAFTARVMERIQNAGSDGAALEV